MSQTILPDGNKYEQYKEDIQREYIRESALKKFFSAKGGNLVRTVMIDKNATVCHLPLVSALDGKVVTGNQKLSGNESSLVTKTMNITPILTRTAVEVNKLDEHSTKINLNDVQKQQVIEQLHQYQKFNWIDELGATVDSNGIQKPFSQSSIPAFNYWQGNNADRIIYGNEASNIVVGDHAASLANIDVINDKMSLKTLESAIDVIRRASPGIKPIRVNKNLTSESFIFLCDPYVARDLKRDAEVTNAFTYGAARGNDNPIFTKEEFYFYDCLIVPMYDFVNMYEPIKVLENKVPWGVDSVSGIDMNTVGTTNNRVAMSCLCGVDTMAYVIREGLELKKSSKDDDYGMTTGVGVSMWEKMQKAYYNDKLQYGMTTVFSSAARHY